MFLLIILSSVNVVASIECHKCTTSALIPGSLGCNKTCTGEYCYRAEKSISAHLSITANETAVALGCLDFPLAPVKLECRRNFEGIVLCVCASDLCNEEAAASVVDLPVLDCLKGTDDSVYDPPTKCPSNYCMNIRAAAIDSGYNGASQVTHFCQKEMLLSKFDLFVHDLYFYIPSGICVKIQHATFQILELCSCPHMQNCTTSTRFPENSGLPLEVTTGLVTCAMLSSGGIVPCTGHVCFIVETPPPYDSIVYGCITYDDRFARFPLGTHRVVDTSLFLCDTNMCNSKKDAETVFNKLPPYDVQPNNGTCNCPSMSIPTTPATATANLSLILGIAIPAVVIALLGVALVSFRTITGNWPFHGKVNQRRTTVISVISKSDHFKNK